MRIIYAFNPKDPPSDPGLLRKHTIRESKSVQLLSPSSEEPKLPDDAFFYDFVMTKVSFNKYLSITARLMVSSFR